MGVWIYILIFIVGATAFILLLATVTNLIVAWAANKFSDKTINNSISAIEAMLPGTDCGECGCSTCAEYARAVFSGKMDADRCTRGDEHLPSRLDACVEEFQKLLSEKDDEG